ncbi:MAG: hypothetical protein KAQ64_00175 [Candidatus Pacebacteria bacterium]|nr:hypothetical protein [Candidatus Paceibacterota bacterium]
MSYIKNIFELETEENKYYVIIGIPFEGVVDEETAIEETDQITITSTFEIKVEKINEHLLRISFDEKENETKINIIFHPGSEKRATIKKKNKGIVGIEIE